VQARGLEEEEVVVAEMEEVVEEMEEMEQQEVVVQAV
jgi:hypothetical protein